MKKYRVIVNGVSYEVELEAMDSASAAATPAPAPAAAPAPAPVKKLYDTLYAAIREGKPQEIKPEDIRRRIAVMQQVYEQNNVPFPKADQ